jgi:hypothetical protein
MMVGMIGHIQRTLRYHEFVSEVRPIHDHAADNLRLIREVMDRAGSSFTSIPGWGGFAIGWTALAAAWLAQGRTGMAWLTVWLVEALAAAVIGAMTMTWKARRVDTPFMSGAARRFFVSYLAPMASGGLLTWALWRAGMYEVMPAVWLLCYGTAFVSSGAFSIPTIPIMGVGFMLLGAAAIAAPFPAGNALLGVGFGGLHIIFGFVIARRYGG